MSIENITIRLLVGGAGLIFLVLGTAHLFLTLFTNRFHARDSETKRLMENDTPVLTRRTTLWNAWIGFNASHSTGAMFFGFILCFAALLNLRFYAGSQIIQAATLANSLFYLWLGVKYWFRTPLIGIVLATLLQLAALVFIYW